MSYIKRESFEPNLKNRGCFSPKPNELVQQKRAPRAYSSASQMGAGRGQKHLSREMHKRKNH